MSQEIAKFVVGESYFLFSYLDREMKLPDIRTIIYLGKAIEKCDSTDSNSDIYCFCDAKHHLARNSLKGAVADHTIRVFGEAVDLVLDKSGLIEELNNEGRNRINL